MAVVLTHLTRGPRALPQDSVTISVQGYATRGAADAGVVILEFTDYQCPFCKQVSEQALDSLAASYVAQGYLRQVVRDLPIPELHPYANTVAKYARCVAATNLPAYWDFRREIYAHQDSLSKAGYLSHLLRELGLREAVIEMCVQTSAVSTAVAKDVSEANAAGITGTPSFVVGVPNRSGTMRGVLIRGAATFTAFENHVRRAVDHAVAVQYDHR